MIVVSFLPILLLILFTVVISVVAYFLYIYVKQKKLLESETEMLHHYERILLKAHTQARKIVQNASKKAEQLLAKSTIVKKDSVALIHKRLNEETHATLKIYEDTLTTIKETTIAEEQQAFQKLTDQAEQDLAAYSKAITNLMQIAEEKIQKQATEELSSIKQELAEYKKNQLQHIDEKIVQKVDQLALEVLGKSLRTEDQRILIEQALQQAEKEGIFEL